MRWEVPVGAAAVAAVLLTGALTPDQAGAELRELGPVVAFLVAIMVLAQACAAEGLFRALGGRVAIAGRRSGRRFLTLAVGVAAVVTAVLSLDATAVLLAPVLVVAARAAGRSPAPVSFAAVRLSNSASTLLPVSNLTNLLVFASTGLSFLAFTAAMAPVWVVAVVAETLVLAWWFRHELAVPGVRPPGARPLPRFALACVGLVLAGFAVGSPLGVEPVWPALVGAALVVAHAYRRGVARVRDVLEAANLPFAFFTLCWALVVIAVGRAGVGALVERVVPDGDGWGALLVVALVAMLLAGLVNNLPATLLLLPLVAPLGPVALLALLVGVNVGANLSYAGSLANLLWRAGLRRAGEPPSGRTFHALGLLTTPVLVVACTLTLAVWAPVVGL